MDEHYFPVPCFSYKIIIFMSTLLIETWIVMPPSLLKQSCHNFSLKCCSSLTVTGGSEYLCRSLLDKMKNLLQVLLISPLSKPCILSRVLFPLLAATESLMWINSVLLPSLVVEERKNSAFCTFCALTLFFQQRPFCPFSFVVSFPAITAALDSGHWLCPEELSHCQASFAKILTWSML